MLRKRKNDLKSKIVVENDTRYNSEGKIVVKSLTDYHNLLNQGITNFDFSEINLKYQDIQNINLENLGLTIDLQEIFFPFSTRSGFEKIGDDFIHLEHSNLKGNNITGELCNFIDNGRICVFLYDENTLMKNTK